MRIRKRTPARAASPGPPPPLSLPLLQQTMEKPREEEDKEALAAAEEEKREIPAKRVRGGGEDDDRVRAAAAAPAAASASGNSSATEAVRKPEEPEDAGRCSRNDGKRWRCKRAAVPGYLLCDRHIAWSTRKRKPRATKKPTSIPPKELAEDHDETQRSAVFY